MSKSKKMETQELEHTQLLRSWHQNMRQLQLLINEGEAFHLKAFGKAFTLNIEPEKKSKVAIREGVRRENLRGKIIHVLKELGTARADEIFHNLTKIDSTVSKSSVVSTTYRMQGEKEPVRLVLNKGYFSILG